MPSALVWNIISSPWHLGMPPWVKCCTEQLGCVTAWWHPPGWGWFGDSPSCLWAPALWGCSGTLPEELPSPAGAAAGLLLLPAWAGELVFVGVNLNLGDCREGVGCFLHVWEGKLGSLAAALLNGAVAIHPDFPLGSFRSSVTSSASCAPCRWFAIFLSVSFPSILPREEQGASLALPVLLMCLKLLGWICRSRGSRRFQSLPLCPCNIIRNSPGSQVKQVPSCQRWKENLRCVQRRRMQRGRESDESLEQ